MWGWNGCGGGMADGAELSHSKVPVSSSILPFSKDYVVVNQLHPFSLDCGCDEPPCRFKGTFL